MKEKIIELTGAEIRVEYSGANAWLRNDGAAVIYAAKSAGISAGADGVVSIPAGGSAPVYGANGAVYLLGSGSVQLIGSDYSTNPFNGVSRGGAADIPTGAAGMVELDGLQGGVPFSEIVLDGDIVGQEVTLRACGKNLADLSLVDGKKVNGVTFAYNSDGSVTVSGTATAMTYIGAKIHLAAGSYTISGGSDKSIRTVLRNTAWLNIADSVENASCSVTTGDYYFHIAVMPDTVCDNVVIRPQLERGSTATAYEPYRGSEVKITPDAVPYIVPNDIRQQDGVNNVMVSAGNVSATGARRNAALKKVWDKLDELTAAIIVSNGD